MKKFYKENRIFVILMGIVVVCLGITIILLFRYFYFGTGKEQVKSCENISNKITENYTKSFEADETVKNSKIRVSDKTDIIYITIEFNEKTALVEAQTKALSSLDIFEEKIRECYDFQFMISKAGSESDEGFALMGALNANGTNVSWNNNTKIDNEDEE